MDNAPATLPRRFCSNHPQRAAIGVCVITSVPICGECSTRYEGVNYSREGLRLLKERRAAAAPARRSGPLLHRLVAYVAVPLFLYAVYLSYFTTAQLFVTLFHPDR